MMVAVFVAMLAALVFGWLNKIREAAACLLLAFALSTVLFFWEVYSPEYGFRMPWIRVEHTLTPIREG